MKHLSLYFYFIILSFVTTAQEIRHSDYFGISFNLSADINIGTLKNNSSGFRTSVAVSYNLAISDNPIVSSKKHDITYLSYQITCDLYKGNIGNYQIGKLKNKLNIDVINNLSLAYGFGSIKQLEETYPIETFRGDLAYSTIIYSSNYIGLSAIYILNKFKRNQMIGSLFSEFKIKDGFVGFNYYNDGTPFQYITKFGDGYDRWWTGGGFLSYRNGNYQVQLMYDKFTGFSPLAFEFGKLLSLDNTYYQNPEESTLNFSKYQVRYKNLAYGFNIDLGINNNPRLDFQNLIHRIRKDPYHPFSFKYSFSIGAGLQNYYQYNE